MWHFCHFPKVSQYPRRTVVENCFFFRIQLPKVKQRNKSWFPGARIEPSTNPLSSAPCPIIHSHKSHPRNKFHPSSFVVRSFVRGPNSCSPNITCPLWEGKERGGGQRGGEIWGLSYKKRVSNVPKFGTFGTLEICLFRVCETSQTLKRCLKRPKLRLKLLFL